MSYPHVNIANKYARDVAAGRIPACKWVVLACERHLSDKRQSRSKGFRYRFDNAAAERVCKFIEVFPHTKGHWAAQGKKLELEPWQCFMICSIFGWKIKGSDLRRFRRALLLVPRKNGKSALAAAIGLYMFAADHEYGAEVYSGATSEKQAWEVFRPARQMAQKTPAFGEYFGVEANASNLYITENASRFEPLIGKPGDGASPSCAIVDEYHEHKTDELLDTMETGMGAREQPLALIITTAGDNMAGPCYALQQDAQKMLEGVTRDDGLFSLIYTIDKDDDWTSLEALKKANPNYGVSVGEEFLQARLNDALNNARKQSTYQTKHLNVWVGARDAYFNVQRWRECANPELQLSDLEGQRCYIGLDLASKHDIAALEILFPISDDEYIRFGWYFLPEETVYDGANEHYKGWMKDGWITVTDGEIIDFREIRDVILELCRRFEVAEVAYDPHQATMLVTQLMDDDVPVVEMNHTVLRLSEPMKTVDAVIRARQIQHNGDPVMTWMMSNVVAKEDAKENVYPCKERAENKIDGAIALIMAMGRAMVDSGEDNGDMDGFFSNPVVIGR